MLVWCSWAVPIGLFLNRALQDGVLIQGCCTWFASYSLHTTSSFIHWTIVLSIWIWIILMGELIYNEKQQCNDCICKLWSVIALPFFWRGHTQVQWLQQEGKRGQVSLLFPKYVLYYALYRRNVLQQVIKQWLAGSTKNVLEVTFVGRVFHSCLKTGLFYYL